MNLFDIAILLLLAGFVIKGLWRGLLRELCSLCGLFGGVYLAVRYHNPLAQLLMESIGWPLELCVVLVFVALLVLTVVFFGLLGFLLSRFVSLIFLGGFNRVAGGLFGLVQGGLLLALLLFGMSRVTLPEPVRESLDRSLLAPPLVDLGAAVLQEGRHALESRALEPAEGHTAKSADSRSGKP